MTSLQTDQEVADSTARRATEARIVDGLLRGDGTAGDRFYELCAGPLYTFIYYRVAGNEDAAHDIVQDTFLAAIDAIDRYQPTYGLVTWLRGIARHKIVDFYRAQTLQSRQDGWETVEHVPDTEDVEGDYEVQESREETLRVLGNLPVHYQQVLTMKYVDFLPQNEIAAQLGQSVEAIESLLARARRAFRNGYGPPGAAAPC